MVPKRIGFLGFEGVTASHLAGPADTFAAAALEDGYGNSISCYQICTLGLASEPFRAESGMIFNPEETLRTAPDLEYDRHPRWQGITGFRSHRKDFGLDPNMCETNPACRSHRHWHLRLGPNGIVGWASGYHPLAIRQRCRAALPKTADGSQKATC